MRYFAGKPAGFVKSLRNLIDHPVIDTAHNNGDVPPSIPHFFIRWLTRPGDVYDPFSGRGTTALEVCFLDRIGLGSDANPMAWILTAAKSNPPSRDRLERRIQDLTRSMRHRSTAKVPQKICILFHPLRFRSRSVCKSACLCCAAMIGSSTRCYSAFLHANARSDGTPRGLTVSMPNTFAMAPNDERNYIQRHKLKAHEVDVLSAVEACIERLEMPTSNFKRGYSWMQDVTKSIWLPKDTSKAKNDLHFTHLPVQHKVSRIWGETRGHATKRIVSSCSAGRKHAQASRIPKIDWLRSNCYGE